MVRGSHAPNPFRRDENWLPNDSGRKPQGIAAKRGLEKLRKSLRRDRWTDQ